ncbi:hypothetical protein OIU79_013031 [Salix purpurea]|uniref:Uncharacterized protein n=1 Tax=Salix purpurea TaxID=77065 RepID=A0A9Q0T455_SALPP|nr:hypothetical protein IMY05_006G0046900 [Salix suchowensis]KAJ6699900.1 hypothetical protein OIU79_013031 [Salix purpurea]
MGFFSSICCCFSRPTRVAIDGVLGAAPVRSNFIESDVRAPILVPHFPVNSKFSRL